MTQNEIFEFGRFRLDVAEHSLREGDRPIPLKPKVFETLVLLVRRAGHLVSKQDLLSQLWPDAVVDETNLNKNIWLIRRALGEGDETGTYIETIPRVGYRFVATVTRAREAAAPEPVPSREAAAAPEREPSHEAAAASPLPVPSPSGIPERRRRRPWRFIGLAMGATLVVALAVAVFTARRARDTPESRAAAARRTISVLGFSNLSGRKDLDWVATALSEMVHSELSAGTTYRILPSESAAHLRRDLALESVASLSPESLARLRRLSPVDEIVSGSYVAVSGGPGAEAQIRIDVLAQDARSGETLSAFSEMGDSSRLFDLVSSLGSRLRLALREPGPSPASAEQARATLPRDPTALQHYSEGLEKLRSADSLGARDLLVRAVAEEPEFPLAHSALGRAYAALGYEEKARLELQQAFQRSAALPAEERLGVESAYRAANKEWDKAIAICQELDRIAPGDLENGLRLANTELNASRAREALLVVRRLHRLPPPAGNDPRIDLLEWGILMSSDPKAALAAAERGLAESRARREVLLEATALLDRSDALQALGKVDKKPVEEALRIFTQAGDSGGEARAAHILGNLQFEEGDIEGAGASFRRGIAAADRIGFVLQKAAAVASLSRVAQLQGDTAEAERLVVEANSIWRAIPDRRQLPWGLNALGVLRAGQGKLDDAVALHREALKMCKDSGDYGSYIHDGYSGLVAALQAQGRLNEAASVAEEALKASRKRADESWNAQHVVELGTIAFERGRLDEADRLFAESLEVRRKLHEYTVPESELLTARLRIEEGRGEEAGKLARSASVGFAGTGRHPDQATAEAAEAEALLVSGSRAEATQCAETARRLMDEKTPNDARVRVLLARARVEYLDGHPDSARSALQTASRLARETSRKDLPLETRLAAAELDADPRTGSAEAAAVATDARAIGFERIARRADRISGARPRQEKSTPASGPRTAP
ncbi:MAG TPA: tetratricopeptide repeat protein [Thermoanaerobaculia bacterium]|nr:tetratricopeptide repeat protein [Thermoanaerobaculia bacterium]